jgi:translation initiation factor 3 subunit B
VTFRGDEVEVHWHGKPSQCKLAYKHPAPNWTDLYVSWSPLGTYFVTLHRPGMRLWGGPSWTAQQKFAHPLVKLLDFSPCEKYLVTWSHDPIVVPEGALQGPQYFSPEDEVGFCNDYMYYVSDSPVTGKQFGRVGREIWESSPNIPYHE